MKRMSTVGLVPAAVLLSVFSASIHAQVSGASCTQVIGSSQVGQENGGWYVTGGAFEARAGDAEWQLLWQNGAGVNRWKSPDYAGWRAALISPCESGSKAPERVVLSVSGPHGDDVAGWRADIDATIDTVRQKLPSVPHIVLQAVVGAPQDSPCYQDRTVRAAWQHYPIREAIREVAAADPGVVEGFAPLVSGCAAYRDGLGHLTAEAVVAVGNATGSYYAKRTR